LNQYALVKKRLKEDVIQISLLRQTECGLKESCGGNCAGCVQQPQGELLATASDPIGVQPGERVEVEPTTGHSIGLSLVVFALPCVFLGLGYLVGQALGLGEGASVERPPWACWWDSSRRCWSTGGSPGGRPRSLWLPDG